MGYQNLSQGASNLVKLLDERDTKIFHFDAFTNVHLNVSIFHLDAGARITKNSKFGEYWVYNINPYLYHEAGNWFGKVNYTFGTAFIAPYPLPNLW